MNSSAPALSGPQAGGNTAPKKAQVETEIQISTEILIMLFLIMLAITLGHFLKKSKHKYMQEAGLTTILGMVAGIVLKQTHEGLLSKKISGHFNNLFMILLLPPIIFEGGYNMQKRPFFKNIGSVLAYSFLGTFVAILISSLLFYATSNWTPDSWWPGFTLKQSFAFGSLISATDPVSVLAIFKEMDADVNLYSIVFGESIFNDAIGIVMYETVRDLGTDKDSTMTEEIFGALGQFTIIFVGSLAIGMVSALLVAAVLKRAALGGLNDFNAEEADASNPALPPQDREDNGAAADGASAE
jgi:NhaP-type Na+/H+ or K+/H+ antiporter